MAKLILPDASKLSEQQMRKLLKEMYYREGAFEAAEQVDEAIKCADNDAAMLYMVRRCHWNQMGWS